MSSLRFEKIGARVERVRSVVEQIRSVPAGEPIRRSLLAKLILLWGNYGYAASVTYLQHVDRLFRESNGPTLECGSGVTTLLLGLLAEKEERYVWTFEDHECWVRHLRGVLTAFSVKHIKVCHTPLRNYGSYSWYKLPTSALPSAFDMVICDGPPLHIRGRRYGLMPVLGDSLPSECRILLEYSNSLKEKKTIDRWVAERDLSWHTLGVRGRCAEITLT